MTRTPETRERIVGCLVGVAVGDALGRPVVGRSSAEIAAQHGRVTEMYADEGGAGDTTAHTRDALAVARWLSDTASAVDDTDGDTAGAAGGESRSAGGDDTDGSPDTVPLVRGVPCGVIDDADRRGESVTTALEMGVTDGRDGEHPVTVERAASARALADLVAALAGRAEPEAAVDAALSAASDRNAPPAVRTALAVALDPVERGAGGPVETLEIAAHDALTARDSEDALVTAVSRGGPTTELGAATGALAGARFGDAFPVRWLDVLDAAEETRRVGRRLCAVGE